MIRLGIDGGGTTTRAVVWNDAPDAQRELARATAPSSNLYAVGIETATQNIGAAVETALQKANVPKNQVISWGFGLAGACSESEKARWRAALQPLVEAPFVVEEDVVAALAGAFDGLKNGGAVLIAGTGVNCFGQSPNGRQQRADGNGPLLGDRGGGYWIGESALRAACCADDGVAWHGVERAQALREAVWRHFGVASVTELIPLVYASDFRRDEVAALAPLVFGLAAAGDVVSLAICDIAARELAATAGAVLRGLEIKKLALVGGLLENPTPVRAVFNVHLQNQVAGVEIGPAKREAVIGAAFLGRLAG